MPEGLAAGAHPLPGSQTAALIVTSRWEGRGSALGLFCKVTAPTMGDHPHDLLTFHRPHLPTPSRLQGWASTLEFGGTNVRAVQHPMESSWKNRAQLRVGRMEPSKNEGTFKAPPQGRGAGWGGGSLLGSRFLHYHAVSARERRNEPSAGLRLRLHDPAPGIIPPFLSKALASGRLSLGNPQFGGGETRTRVGPALIPPRGAPAPQCLQWDSSSSSGPCLGAPHFSLHSPDSNWRSR